MQELARIACREEGRCRLNAEGRRTETALARHRLPWSDRDREDNACTDRELRCSRQIRLVDRQRPLSGSRKLKRQAYCHAGIQESEIKVFCVNKRCYAEAIKRVLKISTGCSE